MKKALVLAGGIAQAALIDELHARGYYTLLADMNPECYAASRADEFCPISAMDLDALAALAADRHVDVVITACADQILLAETYLCEKLGLRSYISYATAKLVSDKKYMKEIFIKNGVPTSRYVILDRFSKRKIKALRYPLIVKPVSEGSTYGLSMVDSPADWQKALDLVFQYGSEALVEEFFSGVEATLGIIAGKPLPMIEIRYTTKVYDYDAKYLHKTCETQYLCHAPSIPEPIQEKLRAASLRFFELSGARDVLRVDLMVNVDTGDFILLEGNSIPGCTANSLVPKAAKAMGMSFPDMCALLLEDAAARYSL